MARDVSGVWRLDAAGVPQRPSIVDTRDQLVECFAVTHGANFAASKAELGLPATAESVRLTVTGLVRMAFSQVGGSYDDPTPESLGRVVELLAERSLSWGTPAELVVEHQAQFQELLALTEFPQDDGCAEGGSVASW